MTETSHETPPTGPPAGPAATGWNSDHLKDYRALRRSREDRKVAGVAGGLGRHLDIDPTILRVLFVVLAFFGGSGLLLYAVLWLLVPEEGSEHTVVRTSDTTRNTLLIAALAGAAILAIGDSARGFHLPWLLVAAVILLAVVVTRDRGTPSPAPSGGVAPPDQGGAWPATAAPPPPSSERSGPVLFGPALALVALALGALGLYDASGGSVPDPAYPALALAVVGLVLAVGAFMGRAGGLILLGLVAVLALLATAIGRPGFAGDRSLEIRPTSVSQLREGYEVPAGRMELDLTRLTDIGALDGRAVALSGNAGEIVVVVPRDVDVSYQADIEYGGSVETPTTARDGWGPSVSAELGSAGDPHLDLDLDLKFGHIEVIQR